MEPRTLQDFIVGSWYVRPSMNLISSESRTVQLEPKVMQMLVALAERGGEVVSREDLHEQLWSDTIVTDKALTRLVSELRKAFGDDPRDPRIIATVSKNGYRLVPPVAYVNTGDGSFQVRDSDIVAANLPFGGPSTPKHRLGPLAVLAIVIVVAGAVIVWILASDSPSGYMPAIQVTSYSGHEISPALSPDGNEVAFSWQGVEGDNWDIYVKQPRSEGLLRLTDHPGDDLHPSWSPDGTRIAFVRYDSSACTINWIPALSGPLRTVAECEWVDPQERPYRTSSIDWSPDGRTIAASDGGIYLIDVETGENSPLTDPPARAIADVNPKFSPDGRTIAFTRVGPLASADLFRVGVDGSGEAALTDEARLILGHAWSRTGNSLLFSSNRGGRFALWRVNADGGRPAPVPADGWNIEKVSVAREGDRMAYEAWIYDTNIWRFSINGDEPPRRVAASTLWDRDPAISPDGNQVVFVSNRSGSWELWLADTDGSGERQLTFLDGPVVAAPRWSPDGMRIAFQAQGEPDANIHVIDMDTGRESSVTAEQSDEVAPAWSPSGRDIYFGSNRSGTWQIWKKPVLGGKTVRITKEGGYEAQPSPDGEFLYVVRDDSAGLWRVPAEGGDEDHVLNLPGRGDWGNWQVTEVGIYLLRRRSGDSPPALVLAGLDGSVSEVTPLERVPTPYHPGLAVAPAGRSVLLTLVDDTDSDLFVMTVGNGNQ